MVAAKKDSLKTYPFELSPSKGLKYLQYQINQNVNGKQIDPCQKSTNKGNYLRPNLDKAPAIQHQYGMKSEISFLENCIEINTRYTPDNSALVVIYLDEE